MMVFPSKLTRQNSLKPDEAKIAFNHPGWLELHRHLGISLLARNRPATDFVLFLLQNDEFSVTKFLQLKA